jgi:protocatechuate 3,4-dioxygenase beta subunit
MRNRSGVFFPEMGVYQSAVIQRGLRCAESGAECAFCTISQEVVNTPRNWRRPMFRRGGNMNRRQFCKSAAQFSAGASVLAMTLARLKGEQPFDSVSPDAWRHARNNGLVMIRRPAPSPLSWRTEIVSKDEPGQRLIVRGQVFAPEGRTPASGVTVYAYNTDLDGYYGDNRTEYPPRLYGWMQTDSAGRFELHTVRPGHYPDVHIPAHIHFSAWGAGYPLQWVEELRFEGDRYITPAMLSEAADQGRFRTIQRLARTQEGALACAYNFRLQSQTNFK